MSMSLEEVRKLMTGIEGEKLEFKEARRSYPLDKLLRYCAAIANEGGGRIALGVTDQRPRKIVGTQAFSQPERTRAGLDRETSKSLLLKHINENESFGSIMNEFLDVLPSHSRSQIQVLLRELVRDGRIHSHGLTRGARWFPGPRSPNCNHESE